MQGRLLLPTLLVAALVVVSLAAAAPLDSLIEFNANAGSAPFRIGSGTDGNLWFSDQGAGAKAIGQITTGGVIHEFGLPAASVPRQVRVGADGNLWFTDTNPAAPGIGRVNPDGTITEFALELGSNPNALALGADGNLWFTDKGKNPNPTTLPAIGRITPDGTITKFRVGLTATSSPNGISPAAGGFLWFTDQGTPKAIGRVQTSGAATGAIEEFTAGLGPNANPAAITTAADGTLWFTDQSTVVASRAIGRVTPDGTITESSVGLVANGQPVEVTPGADGKLWFSDQASPAGALGQITTTGDTWTITNYPLPAGVVPGGIRTGPDGNLWFLDNNVSSQKIGQFGVGAPAASIAVTVAGSGNLGTPQVCNDTWNDWAGQQPSRTALPFDGYQWLLDGHAIAGQTGQSYMPAVGDIGHQLSCSVKVTYTLFPTTVSASSAPVVVNGAAAQLALLIAQINNFNPPLEPGLASDLAGRARDAADHLAEGKTVHACTALDLFAQRVLAEWGREHSSLTLAQAEQLVAAVYAVEVSDAGCLSPASTLPAAEAALVDLIGSINGVADTGVANDLRSKAAGVAKQAAQGDDSACSKLAELQRKISAADPSKLSAADVARLTAGVNAVASKLGC